MSQRGGTWRDAQLVALDLEGSGAQDRDAEAILEIAAVPIVSGEPAVSAGYCTMVNPGRPIANKPWISPGLTNAVLDLAPHLAAVEPILARLINGRVLVGHNINVDWRLLHRRCPAISPSGLLDTLKLARHVGVGERKSLGALLTELELTTAVTAKAPTSQPHRALWDTIGAAMLLRELVTRGWNREPTLDELLTVAGVPTEGRRDRADHHQPSLLDL
ncbi:MAG TPA: 3'-5' exonuclease [Micromonosporaceae bacterium]|nr:3'-5' exonuclease [Micromonosporaceae bacterium]